MDLGKHVVEGLISKDKAAFELVFHQYYGMMVHYAYRFLDTWEESEEIVQDVFVKFWERCDQLMPDTSVNSYLYRSVHNACLNALKREKVQDRYRQYMIQTMESSHPAYDEEVENDTLHVKILKEIDNLPPRCAEIFKLSRLEGLQYQEIADHLHISVKTVEVQMGKALRMLRKSLKDVR